MKILVNKDGWYRVPSATLTGAGFVFPSDPNLLHLSTGGQDVPFQLRSGNLEFYGQQLDTLTTDTRTYWLSVGAGPGLIMQSARVRAAASAPLNSFGHTLVLEDQKFYNATIINGDQDNFFWDPIRPTTPVSRVINVPGVDTGQPSTLRVELQGLTETAHTIHASLNGNPLGTLAGFGKQQMTATYNLAPGALNNGSNTVGFTDSETTADIVLTDAYTLTYQHLPNADLDKLSFPVTPGQPLSIDGFSSNRVRVLDITNPLLPRELFPTIQPTGPDYTISLTPPGGSSRLYAFEDAQALPPKAVIQDVPSNLATPGHQANLVVISHKDFLSSIQPLVNFRIAEGLQVVVADIEDVYDEFSFGNKDKNAIRAFLQYAQTNWTIGPDYALFVGDATIDPRNYLALGNDFIPTNLLDATFLENPSDDSLADFNGDGTPELGVGRLPVRTPADTTHVVNKIINYANTTPPPTRTAVLVSDNFDRGDYHFDQFSDDLRNMVLIPNGVSVTSIYRPENATAASDDAAHAQIVSAASNNPTIVNWFGHGTVGGWAGLTGHLLLQSADAPLLTNTGLMSLYLMMTCQNGNFVNLSSNGLGEALLLRQTPTGTLTPNGAVAVWGSSGDTVPNDQVNAVHTALTMLLTDPSARLGDAMVAAKAAITDIDVKHTWVLLGDPTTKLK